MSKRKNKQAEISIISGPNDSDEVTELFVELKDKTIGIVRDKDAKFYEAEYINNGTKVKFPTIEEAVEHIIMMYNLHEL